MTYTIVSYRNHNDLKYIPNSQIIVFERVTITALYKYEGR